jgi:protein involved in polysaccharide export with SLBB domain
MTYEIPGDGTIDISWAGTDTPGTYTAVFNFDGNVAIPEPGSVALFGVTLACVRMIRRRRLTEPVS